MIIRDIDFCFFLCVPVCVHMYMHILACLSLCVHVCVRVSMSIRACLSLCACVCTWRSEDSIDVILRNIIHLFCRWDLPFARSSPARHGYLVCKPQGTSLLPLLPQCSHSPCLDSFRKLNSSSHEN